jgi:hypothetical protein
MMSCGGQKALSKQNVYSQASAQIVMNNGDAKEGMILKKKENEIIYVDSKSHKKETLKLDDIKSISAADSYYDFSGNVIPITEIEQNKGVSKTLSYGAGGLLLGAAVGTAVGIGLNGVGVDASPYIAMGILGAGGAIWFGLNGSERDFDDSVYETQYKRLQIKEAARKAELKKQLEEEKRKLEESKTRKKELMKDSNK